jgi:hypothetical protein
MLISNDLSVYKNVYKKFKRSTSLIARNLNVYIIVNGVFDWADSVPVNSQAQIRTYESTFRHHRFFHLLHGKSGASCQLPANAAKPKKMPGLTCNRLKNRRYGTFIRTAAAHVSADV